MGHGIRDQLLQLVDEVEKLTTEVFEAVQEGNQAENLLELLMKKDQQLTESLRIADIQLQLHQQITECNAQIELYNGRITRYQKKLSEASDSLLPALSQAKKRLKIIQEAEDKKINAEDIVKYSHKLCAHHANIAPTGSSFHVFWHLTV